MTLLIEAGHKTLNLVYTFFDKYEMIIQVDVPEGVPYQMEAHRYGDGYITNKHVYVNYDGKYKRISLKNVEYRRVGEMSHDVIYNEDLNISENHLVFYELLYSKFNVKGQVRFENIAYEIE